MRGEETARVSDVQAHARSLKEASRVVAEVLAQQLDNLRVQLDRIDTMRPEL